MRSSIVIRIYLHVLSAFAWMSLIVAGRCWVPSLAEVGRCDAPALQEINRLLEARIPAVSLGMYSLSPEQDEIVDASGISGMMLMTTLPPAYPIRKASLIYFLVSGEPFKTYQEALREFVRPVMFLETLEASISG